MKLVDLFKLKCISYSETEYNSVLVLLGRSLGSSLSFCYGLWWKQIQNKSFMQKSWCFHWIFLVRLFMSTKQMKKRSRVFRVFITGFWSFWLHQCRMSIGNVLPFQEVNCVPDLWLTYAGEVCPKVTLGSFVQPCGW